VGITLVDEARLADGTRPWTSERLFARLDELGIVTTTLEHPPVFTVEEARALRGPIPGCHTKNLFLRNKKGRMWLVVCLESRSVDLKALGRTLGAGNLSFGSPDRLMSYLGAIPGAVTPLAVVNDSAGAVRVALDKEILEHEPLNFHPLDNAMTTSIGSTDFLAFLEAQDHAPVFVDFDELPERS
jgi:Ala-tRNA(Pro) deacylase